MSFHTQNLKKAEKDFKKDFQKLLKNAFHGKSLEIVSKRVKTEFIGKDYNEKILQKHSQN